MRLKRPSVFAKAVQTKPSDAPVPAAGHEKKNRRKTLAALVAVFCGGLCASQAEAQLSPLHASGTSIVNANGTVVPLRGVNLGGLFVMEQWMSPLDSGNSHNDTYNVIKTLDSRFGVATEQSLISTYQNSWIQAGDLDNIKNAGFNVIRVPVWWGQFYTMADHSPTGWRSDAFTYLDWLVSAAGARGIYVIIDMHGAVGFQSNSDSTGAYNQNQYWGSQDYQGSTQWMWWKIADHYKGNSNIAGFDLLNEPDNAPSDAQAVSVQNDLYNSVRSADSSRMCIMEGTFDSWNWSMLPPPSQYGWSNVVYSMHEYAQGTNGQAPTDAQVQAGTANQVNDFYNHSYYNVPGYIGEFNDYQYLDAWSNAVSSFNNAGLSWTMWSYKAIHGTGSDSWGYYNPKFYPPIPNIESDSAATIQADWQQWTTANAFAFNGDGINGGGVNTGGGTGTGTGTTGSGVNLSFTAGTASPNISMGSSPSFATFNGKLYAAFRANDSRNILFIATSTDGVNFGSATGYGNIQMGSAPSLAVYNNKLYVAFQANDSSHKLFITSSTDGVTFPAATGYSNIQIGSSPSLAALNGVLYVAFQANDPGNALWIGQSSDGVNFSTGVTGDSTNAAPSLAAFNNNLYLGFRSNDTRNILFVSSSSNGNFGSSTSYSNIAMGSSPALAAANGALYVTFQANDPSHWLFVTGSSTGTAFPAATGFGNISIGGAPTAAAFGSNLSIGFKSDDSRNILFTTVN